MFSCEQTLVYLVILFEIQKKCVIVIIGYLNTNSKVVIFTCDTNYKVVIFICEQTVKL